MPDFVVNGKDNFDRQNFLRLVDYYLKKYGNTAVQLRRIPVKEGKDGLRKFYWTVIIGYFLEHVSTRDDRVYADFIHTCLKHMFIPEIYELLGNEILIEDDILDYDRVEISAFKQDERIKSVFVDKAKNFFAIEFGIIYPERGEVILTEPNFTDWKVKFEKIAKERVPELFI